VNLESFGEIIALDREVASHLAAIAPQDSKIRVWNIADPYGGPARGYQTAAEILRTQVEEYLSGLMASGIC
jgi:protein-tyrosine-phosphatase